MTDALTFPLRQHLLRWEKDWGDLTATDEALYTNLWHVNWSDVEAIWIGNLASGELALMIQPKHRSGLRLRGSMLSRISLGADRLIGKRSVSLAASLFDRPLEEVVEALSAKAERPLGEPPPSRSR